MERGWGNRVDINGPTCLCQARNVSLDKAVVSRDGKLWVDLSFLEKLLGFCELTTEG